MHECGTDLTLVSLFDGIGGFPLAFSGIARTVATCEIDPAAAGVAADHYPVFAWVPRGIAVEHRRLR